MKTEVIELLDTVLDKLFTASDEADLGVVATDNILDKALLEGKAQAFIEARNIVTEAYMEIEELLGEK